MATSVGTITIPYSVSLPAGESPQEEAKTVTVPTTANLYYLARNQRAPVKRINKTEKYGTISYCVHKDLYDKGTETDDGIIKVPADAKTFEPGELFFDLNDSQNELKKDDIVKFSLVMYTHQLLGTKLFARDVEQCQARKHRVSFSNRLGNAMSSFKRQMSRGEE